MPASLHPIVDSPQLRASQLPPFVTKDGSTPTAFLPATPMPLVFDLSKRLQELKDGLNPQSSFYYFYEGQHPNIRAAIKAYEDGKMPLGSTTYFIGGKIVSKAEAAVATTFVWKEVCSSFHHKTFLTCRIQVTKRNIACRVSACTESEQTRLYYGPRKSQQSHGMFPYFVCSGFDFIFNFSSRWRYACYLYLVATTLELESESSMTPAVQRLPYSKQI